MAGENFISGIKENIENTLKKYDSEISNLATNWKGDSYNNLNNCAKDFSSEYKSTITSQLESFNNACNEYKTYKSHKATYLNYKNKYENADEDDDNLYFYKDKRDEAYGKMETSKGLINNYLKQASSKKLEATPLNGKIGDITFTTKAPSKALGKASEWSVDTNSIKHMNEEKSGSGYAERQRRIDYLGGMKSTESEQRKMMTTIQVPVWDGEKETTMPLTVNKKLVDNYMAAFREVCDLKFPVKTDTSQNAFCAYAWNHYRPGGERSDHAYGGTFDINTKDNFGSGNGSKYSLRSRPDVVAAFEKQGFFWGGNWDSSKDDMHFSFTGY